MAVIPSIVEGSARAVHVKEHAQQIHNVKKIVVQDPAVSDGGSSFIIHYSLYACKPNAPKTLRNAKPFSRLKTNNLRPTSYTMLLLVFDRSEPSQLLIEFFLRVFDRIDRAFDPGHRPAFVVFDFVMCADPVFGA